jgi:phenylalanyl-tRNA synthetase beta chain
MRLPLDWLHDHVRPGLDADALAERFDLTGTEVGRVVHHGVQAPARFVVGRVLDVEAHPDADRLRVCRVAVSDGDANQIVCGAPNVAAGQTVAVALPGAVMPDGTRLKVAKLRGVESHGMVLAEDELAIGSDHHGIMVLADGPAPGTPLEAVLPIATDVLELEITPNRPDCLGVYGLAREVHAITGAPLGPAPWADDPGSPGDPDGIAIEVLDPGLCPRFTARVFEDVTIGPSPAWLKARLSAAGQRPINNVVDITNFVMLLTGQPLHAFDLGRIAGGRLVVRRAADGEELQTLDGQARALDSQMMIICDDAGPTSLAGVMGGMRSEVEPDTTRVLMEAATWNGPNIQRTAWRLALRSEASARFEKGLSPGQTLEAQAVAARLMVELCGARLAPGTVDAGGPGPEPAPIRLRDARVAGLLGAEIPRAQAAAALAALGFGTAEAPDGLDVTVPHFRRADVTREADVIEEVARVGTLAAIPATLPHRGEGLGALSALQRAVRRAQDALVGAGLLEAAGWSFAAPDVADRLRLAADDPRRRTIRLANPMSEEQSELRTLLLGSLLDVAARNAARGAEAVRVWESGGVYRAPAAGVAPGSLPDEGRHVAALLAGPSAPPTWRQPAPAPADVFAAKGVLAAVMDALRVPFTVEPAPEPFLHPGRSAAVLLDGERIGWLGEIHPLVTRAWEIGPAAAFEVDLAALESAAAAYATEYRDLTSFPEARIDLAVVVAEDVAAAQVAAVVRQAGGPELERVEVFDVYRGEQVGAGRVSLALRLAFRAPDRTLTDAEVAERRAAIEAALAAELGGELRA